MKHNSTMLALSLGLCSFAAGAQTLATEEDTAGYRRFLLYPHLEKGFRAMALGDRRRALAEFEQAWRLAPNSPMVAIQLAQAYRRFGEPTRAEEILSELRARTPASVVLPLLPTTLSAEAPKSAPDSELPTNQAAPASQVKARRIDVAPVWVSARSRRRGAARAATGLRKTDQAYEFADQAYKASARGEHAAAVLAARQAVRLAPGKRAYRSLLVYELIQTEQFEAADALASQTLSSSAAPGLDDELLARQKQARQHIAFQQFDAANQALAAGQTEVAAESARKAIQYAPDLLPYHLQLIGLLLGAQKWPEAEQAVSDAIREAGPQPTLLMLRAHAVQRSSHGPAVDELNAAQASRRSADLGATPKVVCIRQAFSPWCDVLPAEALPDPAYAIADAAYKAFDAQQHELAVSKARQALQLAPDNPQYQVLLVHALMAAGDLAQTDQEASKILASTQGNDDMLALRSRVRHRMGEPLLAALDAEAALQGNNLSLSSEIDLLLQLKRQPQARERFAAALREGALATLPTLEVAYLALRVGDDAAALAAFERAARTQALPMTALQDAAYTAGRLGRNEVSVGYFKQAIEAGEAGQLPLAPQSLLHVRRAVADQTRKGGVYGSVTYRGIAASGLSLTPGVSNDTVQAGLEAYWRPLGYGDGRLLELYGGLSGTLHSEVGLTTGAPSVQGTLGARVKPLAAANLVLALERRLKVGSQTEDDWLARIAYSWSQGLDLRVDQPDWWSAQVYAESGRFIERQQNYTTFEGQAGRSFRLDQTSPRLVIFPHLVLGADHNTGYAPGRENAVGAGVGASLRYGFNEDRYTAPRSYWDASLQYRSRLSGDERAGGTFFRFTLSY